MHDLPNNLKKLRIQNKMTQQNVAEYLKLTQQGYSRFETGTCEPDIDTLIKLSELFNTPIDILVGNYIKSPKHSTNKTACG